MITDEARKVRQGANPDTPPEVLSALALDPSVTVRSSLALNPALPPHVHDMLAADADARVRSILGRKIANLAPGLSGEARQQVQSDAIAALTALVAEAAVRVRTMIAQTVSEMPDGPRQIILRLAHDPDVMVSEPVILFSPMLTAEDLISLITSGPPPSTLNAVARRPALTEAVSDAIVANADAAAIDALLRNPTAQIREATLDALAAQSEEHTEWQEPLVRRPNLPPRAARILSEIVSTHLLDTLAARDDLDPRLAQTLRATLGRAGRQAVKGVQAELSPAAAFAQATAMKSAGRLDDKAILAAVRQNMTVTATAMFAVKADVPVSVLEKACALRDAKAVVSLSWKAGLAMPTAVALQAVLALVPPDQLVLPAAGGSYPLNADDMRAQLDLLGVGKTGMRLWSPRRLRDR